MSDLLEQRPRDATTLSFKEREIIKEGLNYLETRQGWTQDGLHRLGQVLYIG